MKHRQILPAWGRILRGQRPLLSLEITRECPLRCPGCYAYEPEHLGSAGPVRQLSDLQGDRLIAGVLALVRRFRPMHISIVGGEPLVRWKELLVLLPKLGEMGIEVQLVTSAVRPIPREWKDMPYVHLVVSIDGLQPEHDARRTPATYDRILKHIAEQRIIVHCTVTRQQTQRAGYLREFARFWSEREECRKIWFSLFTPQQGQESAERLEPADRARVVGEIARMRGDFPKLQMSDIILDGYLRPPPSPQECIFAQTTTNISADLSTHIEPCQFGGDPVCSECGCIASAGLASIGKFKLAGLFPVSSVFALSQKIGAHFAGGEAAAAQAGAAPHSIS